MQQEKQLSADIIKYIAVTAMFIDHIASAFVEFNSVLGQTMHILGRITAPIMSFFIAEGFHYTKNMKRYVLRLAVFALISWYPFIYKTTGESPITIENGRIYINPQQSMIFTLLLALLSLTIIHSEKIPLIAKPMLIVILIIISLIGDWYCFPLIWAMIFDKFREDYKKQAIAFTVTSIIMILFTFELVLKWKLTGSLFQFGVLLALPLLYLYNGKKSKNNSFNKWFFYIFYPAHMVIIGLLKFN